MTIPPPLKFFKNFGQNLKELKFSGEWSGYLMMQTLQNAAQGCPQVS